MRLYQKDTDFPTLYEIVLAMVRRTLREEWDPLHISDQPTAYDEYDCYAPGLATMLMHGVDQQRWSERRLQLVQHMALDGAAADGAAIAVFELMRERANKLADTFYE